MIDPPLCTCRRCRRTRAREHARERAMPGIGQSILFTTITLALLWVVMALPLLIPGS